MTEKPPSEFRMAMHTMASIVVIIIVAEVLTMLALDAFAIGHRSPVATAFIDAGLLALIVAPPIYWLVLLPLRHEYEKRLVAESHAEDMSRVAITDSLTHIMNRRGITVALLDAMAQSERYNTSLCVALADIDHFKQINDSYGHPVGDKVLTEIAGILAEGLRMPDKVGRYGGEEFLVVLPHTALAGARKIAERLRAAVNRGKFRLDGKSTQVTISIGLTQFRKGEDLEQLLARADQALYAAKNGGRNIVVARKVA